MAAKTCTETGCAYPKKDRHPKWCVWHWLIRQPADDQTLVARARRKRALDGTGAVELRTVPADQWPAGERWCSGCQSFVPLWYCSGSRCKACQSAAQHAAHVKATYGLEPAEYAALYEWQGGRCYICQRKTTRRLAVDHDHTTGAVRGLLCSDNERGCNHAILGNMKDVEMARRIVAYLERPPLARLRGGEHKVGSTAAERVQTRQEAYQRSLAAMFPAGPLAQAFMEKDAAEIRAQAAAAATPPDAPEPRPLLDGAPQIYQPF